MAQWASLWSAKIDVNSKKCDTIRESQGTETWIMNFFLIISLYVPDFSGDSENSCECIEIEFNRKKQEKR